MLPTGRAGKAMRAVSGRDTYYTWPEPASKNATTSLGTHGFASPLGGVLSTCRLRETAGNLEFDRCEKRHFRVLF